MELNRPPVQFSLMSKFYRNDCMIFAYQQSTLDIVAALRSIAPEGHGFSDDFRKIIRKGIGRKFKLNDHQH